MEEQAKAIALTTGLFGAIIGAATGTGMVAVSDNIAALKTWQKMLVVVGVTGATAGVISGLSYVAYSALTK